MTKEHLIRVFWDTQRLIDTKYPIDGVEVKFYHGDLKAKTPKPNRHTPVSVIRGGTASTGYALADGAHVALLNFADAMKYGGWVEDGAPTQEENLCRCTNLHRVLEQEECQEEYYIPNILEVRRTRREQYLDNIIYAKGITIFKDDNTYEDIAPRQVDIITCPSPATTFKTSDEAVAVYRRRVEQILLSAIENGADTIVLGAWGCGAFGQNPSLVARGFAEALNEYGDYFKDIVFAIKETPNWAEVVSNYLVFRVVLETFYKGGVK